MNFSISVLIASVCVFVLSSVWYMALTPVEVRVLGAAPDRGSRPITALFGVGVWAFHAMYAAFGVPLSR